jgi:hypothetical protein
MIPEVFNLTEFVAEGKKQVFNAAVGVMRGDVGASVAALQKIEVLKVCAEILLNPFEQYFFEFALMNQCARLRREFTHKFLP